jgi:hypothetical protein
LCLCYHPVLDHAHLYRSIYHREYTPRWTADHISSTVACQVGVVRLIYRQAGWQPPTTLVLLLCTTGSITYYIGFVAPYDKIDLLLHRFRHSVRQDRCTTTSFSSLRTMGSICYYVGFVAPYEGIDMLLHRRFRHSVWWDLSATAPNRQLQIEHDSEHRPRPFVYDSVDFTELSSKLPSEPLSEPC